MGSVVRNQVTIVRCGLIEFVGRFEDGMAETSVDKITQRVALNDVVT